MSYSTHRGLFLLLVFLLGIVPNAIAKEEEKGQEKRKTGAAAYNDFKEPYRTQFIKQWKERVNQLKQEIAGQQRDFAAMLRSGNFTIGGGPDADGRYSVDSRGMPNTTQVPLRSPAGKEYIQQRKAVLKETREKLRNFIVNDPPFIPIPTTFLPNNPIRWRPGDTGLIGSNVKIIQIIDKDKMLVSAVGSQDRDRRIVMLSGFPTEGRTDNSIHSVMEPVEITGTTTYTAVNGSMNTVLVLKKAEPFDREAYIRSLK
jgi:hypothetical protein